MFQYWLPASSNLLSPQIRLFRAELFVFPLVVVQKFILMEFLGSGSYVPYGSEPPAALEIKI